MRDPRGLQETLPRLLPEIVWNAYIWPVPSLTRRACTAGALLALTLAGTGASAATGPGKRATIPTSLASPAEVAAMTDLETKMTDSLREGKAVPVEFGSAARTPGNVVATGGWGDSGLWTGVYLGGEALRYAVARRHLQQPAAGGQTGDQQTGDNQTGDHQGEDSPASPPAADVAFWTAQRDQALARIRVILAAEHRDITIAQDWSGSLRIPPDVNTTDPTGTHTANFGGGVVHGEPGMIMRACTPVGLGPLGVDDPTVDAQHPVNNNSNRVFRITWTHGDGRTYNCETSPSRDTYAGVTFGLLTAFDLVGPDAPDLRDQIRTDLVSMGDFLLKYGWSYPRPHGYVSAKHDFDGAISPLMVYVPMARLNMTNAVRHVADAGGAAADRQKWDAVWAEELATEGPQLAASMEIDSAQPYEGYYKFNLHHLTGFNLLRTTSGTERDLIAQAVGVMDRTTGSHLNAHFEAITFAVTGDRPRLDAAVTHLHQWLDYRSAVEAGPVRNSSHCGSTLVCVPQDSLAVEQSPVGTVQVFPGQPEAPPVSHAARLRAASAIPVGARPPSDFVWQRPPTDLDGSQPATHREPGIDFLTPYWMVRYFTEVAPPAATPLPVDPGPAMR